MKYWWYVKSEEYARHLYNIMVNKSIHVIVVIYKYEDNSTRVLFMSNVSQNKVRKLFNVMVNTFKIHKHSNKIVSSTIVERNNWVFPYPPDEFHCCKVCGGWECGHREF